MVAASSLAWPPNWTMVERGYVVQCRSFDGCCCSTWFAEETSFMPWSSNSCRSYWFRQGSFLRPLVVVVVFRRRAMVREMHAAHSWSFPCASSRFLCVYIGRKGSSMHGRHGRKRRPTTVPERCIYRRRGHVPAASAKATSVVCCYHHWRMHACMLIVAGIGSYSFLKWLLFAVRPTKTER